MKTDEIIRGGRGVGHLDEMTAGDWPISERSLFRHDVWVLDCAPPANVAAVRFDWRRLPPTVRDRMKMVAWLAVANPVANRRAKIGSFRRLATSLERLGAYLASVGEDGFADLDGSFGDDHVAAFAVWAAERAEEEADREATLDDEDVGAAGEGFAEQAGAVAFGPSHEDDGSWLFGGAGEGQADGWDPRYRGFDGRLARIHVEGGAPTPGAVRAIWQVWNTIYDLGPQLARLGVPALPVRQFEGRGMTEFLRQWGAARERAVSALPEAVWLAVVRAAERMVGTPAQDVIRLLALVLAAIAEGATLDAAVLAQAGFGFSTLEGEAGPWHPPFAPGWEEPPRALRALVRLVRDAGLVVELAEVGLRPSELVSLAGGRTRRARVLTSLEALERGERVAPGAEADMPTCVVERLSQSGMSVAFYLEGHLHKRRRRPLPVDWVLGARREQGDDPPAFAAIDMLETLFAPLRAFADPGSAGLLVLDFATGSREALRMGQLTTGALGASIARSISRFADLGPIVAAGGPELARYARTTSRGVAIAPYQFRKSYAQAVFRIDARLKDAIAQQLKHATVAITDRFYITRDPTLARHMGTLQAREANRLYDRLLGGELRLGATMGPVVERIAAEARAMAGPVADHERRAALASALGAKDFRIWFSEDAYCFIGLRPRASLCNRAAGTADWKMDEPNLATRDLDLCAECPCSAFSADHAPALLRSFVVNRRGWLRADAAGLGDGFLAWRARAERDRGILRSIDVRIPSDEEVMA